MQAFALGRRNLQRQSRRWSGPPAHVCGCLRRTRDTRNDSTSGCPEMRSTRVHERNASASETWRWCTAARGTGPNEPWRAQQQPRCPVVSPCERTAGTTSRCSSRAKGWLPTHDLSGTAISKAGVHCCSGVRGTRHRAHVQLPLQPQCPSGVHARHTWDTTCRQTSPSAATSSTHAHGHTSSPAEIGCSRTGRTDTGRRAPLQPPGHDPG
mmetsp:Transcript_48644/g.145292  ORF Transcript_48644/g.145292 Transcript_48644/m.145292 type:complete len:210 (-) Transcript_48644:193-822(-)